MKIKECVGKGFGAAKGSMNVIGLLFIFGAIWNVINVALTPKLQAAGNTPTPAVSAAVIVSAVVFMLLSIFLQGGSLGYVHALVKQGKADLAAFTGAGKKYYVKLLLFGLLVGAAVIALILLAAVLIFVFSKTAKVVGIILALLLAALGIYLALLIILAPYSIVVDGERVIASVKRSIHLVRAHMLTVLGIIGLLVLIGFGFGIVMGALLALFRLAMPGNASDYLFGVLGSFVNAYLGFVVTVSFMNFYLSISSNTQGAN